MGFAPTRVSRNDGREMNSDARGIRAETLSVIVPTYREAANVGVLFERLQTALAGLPWEMIVVDDDSPDGTADIAYAIAARDARLRCLRRIDRTGLAGAVVEGWLASSADLVAVIDGDLQHDETILQKMYAALVSRDIDLVIGTRVADETVAALSPARQKLSELGAWLFRRVAGTSITDPMSGFFMTRREIVAKLAPRLSPDGFKILVDLVLSSDRPMKIVEEPYVFRKRVAGESKLSPLVGLDFLGLVAHHATRGVLPIRFVLFALIGAIGLVVHLVVLLGLIRALGARDFAYGQIVATIAAMASNFVLNNEITYRSHRYRGLGMIGGFLLFALLCSVGAITNVNIASFLFHSHERWWIAGFAGGLVGVVWNYAASTTFVWRRRLKR
jgi:dolichol-phosphate mannosyltransferase